MIKHVTRIGSGATSTASWDVLRALAIAENNSVTQDYRVTGIEADSTTELVRAEQLLANRVFLSTKKRQLENPDYRFALKGAHENSSGLLSKYAISHHGLTSGDTKRMILKYWEVKIFGTIWKGIQSTVKATTLVSGAAPLSFSTFVMRFLPA